MGQVAARIALAFLLSLLWCATAGGVVVPGVPDAPPTEAAPPAVTPTPAPPPALAPDPAPGQEPQSSPPPVDPVDKAGPGPEASPGPEARRAAQERAELAARQRQERIAQISREVEEAQRAPSNPDLDLDSIADQSNPGGGLADTVQIALIALAALIVIGYVFRGLDPAWALTIGICLTVFSGNWGLLGLPPMDRLFIAMGTFALLARIGPSRDRPNLRFGPIHVLLLAVSIYAILSAVWAGTITEPVAYFGLLDRLGIVPFLMFTIAPLAFRTRHQRSILLGGLVALGGYLGITSFFETLGLSALVFPSYILDPNIGIHVERARGPFVEAAANGLALFICAVAGFVAFSIWENVRLRIFAASVTLLCLFGTIFTLTRAIWLSCAVAVIVTLLAARELRRYLLPTMGIGLFAVIAALAFVPSLQDNASERGSDQRPVWDRLNLASAAQRMVEDKPLLGFGWNRSTDDLVDYLRQADEFPLTASGIAIHNVYLSNAVELGLIGAGLWLVALLMAIGTSIARRGPPELRLWRIGMIAVAIQWAIVANFVPLFFAFPNMMLWVWAGVLATQYVDASEDVIEVYDAPQQRITADLPDPEYVYEPL